MVKTVNCSNWPPRPDGEVFPELLDTTLVAQLLLYDRAGRTMQQASRSVRSLVRDNGLPTMGKVGGKHIFSKAAVTDWLSNRTDPIDGAGCDG